MSALECHYCGLVHPLVEAGGVHYCPNRLCTGPGSWSHRKDLKSFKDVEGGYTVDAQEVLDSVRANTNPDPIIWVAECKAVAKWLRRGIDEQTNGWLPKVSTEP